MIHIKFGNETVESTIGKKIILQQHLFNDRKVDIIILQETHGLAKLSGYKLTGNAEGETKAITTLVKGNLTVIQHFTGIRQRQHSNRNNNH